MTAFHRKLAIFLVGSFVGLAVYACNLPAQQPMGLSGSSESTPVYEELRFASPTAPPQSAATLGIEPYFVILSTPLPTEGIESAPVPQPQAVSPAIPESRRLTLEYPPTIRLGDTDTIRLTLEVDNLGKVTPTAIIRGNTITGTTVEIPNLYDTHKVTAEARLDLAGPIITPPDIVSEPLLPGESVTFYWSVRPQEAGSYRGTVWLSLRFVNKSNENDSTEKTVSIQQLQIEATTFLGLKANTARAAGGVGSFIGGILGFPFIDDILKWLLRRLGLGK